MPPTLYGPGGPNDMTIPWQQRRDTYGTPLPQVPTVPMRAQDYQDFANQARAGAPYLDPRQIPSADMHARSMAGSDAMTQKAMAAIAAALAARPPQR
jgi:hypothetical protein